MPVRIAARRGSVSSDPLVRVCLPLIGNHYTQRSLLVSQPLRLLRSACKHVVVEGTHRFAMPDANIGTIKVHPLRLET